LTRRGTPLAPLEAWRVASPTPQIKTKAGLINSRSYTNDHQSESPSDDLFGEVISSYTDAEALEDGFLGENPDACYISGLPIGRITSNLFDDLKPFVEAEAALFDGNFVSGTSPVQ